MSATAERYIYSKLNACKGKTYAVTFSDLNGKRIAVVVGQGESRSVCCGIARYVFDADVGHCLRVAVPEQPGEPCFLFSEATGGYEVLPDREYGCDYSIIL